MSFTYGSSTTIKQAPPAQMSRKRPLAAALYPNPDSKGEFRNTGTHRAPESAGSALLAASSPSTHLLHSRAVTEHPSPLCPKEKDANAKVVLSSGPLLLSLHPNESTSPAEPVRTGCIVTVHLLPLLASPVQCSTADTPQNAASGERVSKAAHVLATDSGMIKSRTESELQLASQRSDWKDMMLLALSEWKTQPVDTALEIASAVQRDQDTRRSSSSQVVVNEEELLWWRHRDGRLPLRNLAKLRRVLLPLSVRTTEQGRTVAWSRLEYSLADLLLRCKETQSVTVALLLRYLTLLQKWTTHIVVATTRIRLQYRRLQDLLFKTLRRVGGQRNSHDTLRLKLDRLGVKRLPKSRALWGWGFQRAYPLQSHLLILDIQDMRRELIEDFQNDQIELKRRRIVQGAELWTDHDMTEGEFLLETNFMHKVNATLRRPFDPLVSRRRLARVQLTDAHVAKLKAVLFNADGALNSTCRTDVSASIMHHYIRFANAASAGKTDKRWQVPILKHHSQKCVQTRLRIESILIDAGIIDPSKEKLHDISLLVGGTEDQSLHHDMPRQMACWMPKSAFPLANEDEEAILGWETNRLAYNSAMSSSNAPCSMLVGMGDNGISVGVQKDQIERRDGERKRCQIVDGDPDECFSIARENEHLVVLEAKPGVVFTGDFPHAGVRNFASASSEDQLVQEFVGKIDVLLESDKEKDNDISAVVDILCSFSGLNRICRFFCSTELLETRMIVPTNVVGFTDCYDNAPDGHEK